VLSQENRIGEIKANIPLKFLAWSADINIVRTLLLLLTAMLALAADRSLPRSTGGHTSMYCQTCKRTPSGRIKRNSAARSAFRRQHPCPSTGNVTGTCPGYVIDHIKALKRGGPDIPEGKLEAGNLRNFVFKRHEVVGLFRKRIIEFSIKLILIGREIRSAEGDLSNIDKFEIPEDLKKLILGAKQAAETAGKVIAAGHGALHA
jgi:hypothetical protein